MPKGYCVVCKKKREFKDKHIVETKNGGKAYKGHCATCGTTMYRFKKKDGHKKKSGKKRKSKKH